MEILLLAETGKWQNCNVYVWWKSLCHGICNCVVYQYWGLKNVDWKTEIRKKNYILSVKQEGWLDVFSTTLNIWCRLQMLSRHYYIIGYTLVILSSTQTSLFWSLFHHQSNEHMLLSTDLYVLFNFFLFFLIFFGLFFEGFSG